MKVWIVMKGERYEGGHVDAVYANEADAKAYFEGEVERLKQQWKEIYEVRPGYLEERTEIKESWACVACDTIEYFSAEVL